MRESEIEAIVRGGRTAPRAWRLRVAGVAVSLGLAALVSLGLFELMQAFVRPPAEVPAGPVAAPVEWLAKAPERATPEHSRPRHRAVPETVGRPAPQTATSTAPVHIRRPSLAFSPYPAAAAPSPVLPPAAPQAGRRVEWRAALHDYLRADNRALHLFKPPKLRPRPPSPLELPQRMRLGTGGEIDRIGTQCFAAPFDVADNPEASPTPVIARAMHAMQSLFARRVACDPGTPSTEADDFLRKLHKLMPAAPSPGTGGGPG